MDGPYSKGWQIVCATRRGTTLWLEMDSLNLVPRYGADEGAAVARPSTADILTYFFLPEFSYWMMAHIAIMTVTWVFILPIGM